MYLLLKKAYEYDNSSNSFYLITTECKNVVKNVLDTGGKAYHMSLDLGKEISSAEINLIDADVQAT